MTLAYSYQNVYKVANLAMTLGNFQTYKVRAHTNNATYQSPRVIEVLVLAKKILKSLISMVMFYHMT